MYIFIYIYYLILYFLIKDQYKQQNILKKYIIYKNCNL